LYRLLERLLLEELLNHLVEQQVLLVLLVLELLELQELLAFEPLQELLVLLA
jgi:hypothetical protein